MRVSPGRGGDGAFTGADREQRRGRGGGGGRAAGDGGRGDVCRYGRGQLSGIRGKLVLLPIRTVKQLLFIPHHNLQRSKVAGHHFLSILSKGKGTIHAWVLMAEMVSSAVVNEAVSQIMSDLISRHEEKQKSKAKESLERLEMVHIKLDAALGTSEKWHITDASLLRWRKKLKRAAQECDDTLQKCKHRIIEEEQIEQEGRDAIEALLWSMK
nr:unnamed protein product [Digitaria exilis]CAB3455577.1 unnamed protein product [Digitaria exilis]